MAKASASAGADVKTREMLEQEQIAAEIARNEEYVDVQLFKDNGKYKDDVYVAVGNENCLIKRGIPVRIKRKFWNVIEESMREDFLTARLIEQKSNNSI